MTSRLSAQAVASGKGRNSPRTDSLGITLISLHGLIRAQDPELGRDADTGGQIKYVLELARELAEQPNVREVRIADAADHRSRSLG